MSKIRENHNKTGTVRTIKVDYLARVEGEGGLHIRVKNDRVTDVKLKIFEPPRFFESFLQGRQYYEAPDITARICGICPIAYQMSSIHAMENAFGVKIDGQIRELRRLLYCGEWIESHALHVYMLHAPDFLGYADAIQMAKDYPEVVLQGLEIKKTGNELVTLLGGREIHPINVRVGGFYKAPAKRDFAPLVEKLKRARDLSLEMVRFAAGLNFPDFEQDYEFVALRHPHEYPFNEGRLVSNRGLDIDISEYNAHFEETHVQHSTALHSAIKERGAYFVGPLARYSLNYDRLPPMVQQVAGEAGLGETCCNPFKSIIVRSLETLYACDEALRIIDAYEKPPAPSVEIKPRAGWGYGCTEAPRGILFHRYELDEKGFIRFVQIVPPTSQNQKTIENDLWHFVETAIDLPEDKLTWHCEQAIRNYDPCISCSVHFLNLEIEHE
ncbi:MAG TPA: Ni/Fe hydrogenase subunit alpha [Aggregatilineales bacterium]|nr:Ni/Fe hydrogenase subunit alpha [Aggregatilineales bacterium]